MRNRVDVLIPARAGSVGLPGKNRINLVDRSLFLHSVACAMRIDGVKRVFVSTDDSVLADEAISSGAFVPEIRPSYLAANDTPMVDVIQYAAGVLQANGSTSDDFLLLLDPTSPLRDPGAINSAIEQISQTPEFDGFVSVSVPSFNPLWVGVILGEDGKVHRHPAMPGVYTRRQEVPDYWRINGSFYAWKNEYARTIEPDWLDRGTFLGIETPELLSHSIDTIEDFKLAEALLTSHAVSLPWMENSSE